MPLPKHMAMRFMDSKAPRSRRRNPRRNGFRRLWPSARTRRRWLGTVRAAPAGAQVVFALIAVLATLLALNWIYQVVRKPSELWFPVSGAFYKTPAQTWKAYGALFEAHATGLITPELLAALAQVEGTGNPVVRTYWRWSMQSKPFEIYRPASSAVGMYQITDGTFAQARQYCVHDHVAVEDGPWHQFGTCWFNGLYTRTRASDAVEMTSAYLDRTTTKTLQRLRITDATLRHKQDLAAVIHLCGSGSGTRYAKRGFRLDAGQRCGDHDAKTYLARVNAVREVFRRLSSE